MASFVGPTGAHNMCIWLYVYAPIQILYLIVIMVNLINFVVGTTGKKKTGQARSPIKVHLLEDKWFITTLPIHTYTGVFQT